MTTNRAARRRRGAEPERKPLKLRIVPPQPPEPEPVQMPSLMMTRMALVQIASLIGFELARVKRMHAEFTVGGTENLWTAFAQEAPERDLLTMVRDVANEALRRMPAPEPSPLEQLVLPGRGM